MGTELLAHIGVPFLVAFVVLLFRAATREKQIGLEDCNEMALEMSILGIGATGGIFVNPVLIQHYEDRNGLYSILVVLSTMILAAFIVYRSRFHHEEETSTTSAVIDLFLGSLSLAMPLGLSIVQAERRVTCTL